MNISPSLLWPATKCKFLFWINHSNFLTVQIISEQVKRVIRNASKDLLIRDRKP